MPIEAHTIELMRAEPELNAKLNRLYHDHKLAHAELLTLLRGRRVRFRAWVVGGLPRTGTIVSASVEDRSISVGVDVDRVDGRPGFSRRQGLLADTWYGWLEAVEVVDEV